MSQQGCPFAEIKWGNNGLFDFCTVCKATGAKLPHEIANKCADGDRYKNCPEYKKHNDW